MKLDSIQSKTLKSVIKRDGGVCKNCGSINELTIDHIVPISFLEMMGINRKYSYSFKKHGHNLQILCRKCNALKSYRFDWTDERTRPLIDWYLDNLDMDLVPEYEELYEIE